MKTLLGLSFFAVLSTLAVAPASADEVKWSAMQQAGAQWDCSPKYMNTRWMIVETGKRITLQADSRPSRVSWRLGTQELNPDGSGRINISYHGGRPAWFEFAAGHGPRMVQFNYNYQACVWQLHPA
jgi:hypothetical protein